LAHFFDNGRVKQLGSPRLQNHPAAHTRFRKNKGRTAGGTAEKSRKNCHIRSQVPDAAVISYFLTYLPITADIQPNL